MFFVEFVQQIELLPLFLQGGVVAADVFDQLFDSRVLRVDISALIDSRQETRLPVLCFLDRIPARTHGAEARQIQVLRTQPISHPRTDAGPALDGVAAIHQHQ